MSANWRVQAWELLGLGALLQLRVVRKRSSKAAHTSGEAGDKSSDYNTGENDRIFFWRFALLVLAFYEKRLA